ncbi:hypothetical protein LY78DRAFT_275329 [Colletotrichum sublineola]|nr:hypothetical protein LY78DRAFT_275329 [Colletotrichum sublineola]
MPPTDLLNLPPRWLKIHNMSHTERDQHTGGGTVSLKGFEQGWHNQFTGSNYNERSMKNQLQRSVNSVTLLSFYEWPTKRTVTNALCSRMTTTSPRSQSCIVGEFTKNRELIHIRSHTASSPWAQRDNVSTRNPKRRIHQAATGQIQTKFFHSGPA